MTLLLIWSCFVDTVEFIWHVWNFNGTVASLTSLTSCPSCAVQAGLGTVQCTEAITLVK